MPVPRGYKHTTETLAKMRTAQQGNKKGLTHGMNNTPTYRSWANMKSRCLNPNTTTFSYYGGRGITVCDRWLTFENFFADMGKRPEGRTLDRINTDGNYEPNNCCWATRSEQQRNKRPFTRRKEPVTTCQSY